uniref:Uncharacterized protein n=1 Tax=Cucumis melo TaxID=3656 RepID=A0A9I9E9C3_CUCME
MFDDFDEDVDHVLLIERLRRLLFKVPHFLGDHIFSICSYLFLLTWSLCLYSFPHTWTGIAYGFFLVEILF